MTPDKQNILKVLAFLMIYNTVKICHKIFDLQPKACE